MRTVLQIWIATAAVLAGLLLGSLGASQNEKEAEVLLQAAMNTELVKGDLEAAIQQYKRILASHAGSRAVVAKALVRMGHCYERLGNIEARQAYERVVREYALIRRRGHLLSREQLLDAVWGAGTHTTDRVVDNHMMNLRRKIEQQPDAPRRLVSVRGLGYRFEE